MKFQNGVGGTIFLIWLVVVLTIGIGWVLNITSIIHSDFAHLTGLLVLRIIGVFIVPLGSILGYFF